ncbi:MAG: YjbQ family protein [Promethearchaeia archaeon]
MSEHRLYLPDFSGIFGQKFANPFLYGKIDSLMWPIFTDLERSNELEALLSLTNEEDHPVFYHRQISLEHLKIELDCSSIDLGLLQAMDLGREYGITNQDVFNVMEKDPHLFKPILSYDFSTPEKIRNALSDIKDKKNKFAIAGVVLYPSYTKFDLTAEEGSNSKQFERFLTFCENKNLFIKIDVGNLFLPHHYPAFTTSDKLKSFFSHHPSNIFILSGLDISGDFTHYYQLLKYFNNVWVEIDPRSFGGSTPASCFMQLLNLKGFIQNSWHRLCIGSATPTLESSQMMRGFLEATEDLSFAQKNLLRTWGFRNLNRVNPSVFKPVKNQNIKTYNTHIDYQLIDTIENSEKVLLTYRINMRSYSITQLIFLTDLIKQIFEKSVKEYPDYKTGHLLLKSYHTTTTLIVNEHEQGNYLDLHYMFAEKSKKPTTSYLHTVRALENRADFNHYDHELASTYGNRQLIIPIINQELEIGGRENYYILVTFGPRNFDILIRLDLLKSNR